MSCFNYVNNICEVEIKVKKNKVKKTLSQVIKMVKKNNCSVILKSLLTQVIFTKAHLKCVTPLQTTTLSTPHITGPVWEFLSLVSRWRCDSWLAILPGCCKL